MVQYYQKAPFSFKEIYQRITCSAGGLPRDPEGIRKERMVCGILDKISRIYTLVVQRVRFLFLFVEKDEKAKLKLSAQLEV